MNYFLIFVILAICGGGYYEYTIEQQKDTQAQQQISDLTAKIDSLQSDNKKLEDDKAGLDKSLKDAQTQVADLTAQFQAAKKDAQQAKSDAAKQAAQAPLAMH